MKFSMFAIFVFLALPALGQEKRPNVFFHDRGVLTLALAQTGANLYDGVTTARFVKMRLIAPDGYSVEWPERDPVARFFLGRQPEWDRMVPLGAAQIGASAFLSHYIHTRRGWERHLWWVPQTVQIVWSSVEASRNLRLSPGPLLAYCQEQGHCPVLGSFGLR